MDEPTTLRIDRREDRTWVTLDRHAARNAIDAAMVAELHRLCDELQDEPKVLVVTGGADGVFAGGADVGELLARRSKEALVGINLRLFERIRALPMPTVAAVDGWALGGGAELAYACDLRVGTTRAKFGQPEPQLGILAGAGATFRLIRLLGESLTKQMLLAGRTLEAHEALRFGLLSEVAEPEQLFATVDALIDRMLAGSAKALRLTKLAVDAPADAHPNVDLLAQAVLFEDIEKFDRMTAFLGRRRARQAQRG
ncbi:putative enoyl-CoA hydratase/isomerase [Mycobacterium lentiflavum]|uniref:Putative enoyl-CoA hydratase/isomerase n=1 Tax=Mycobacterium lentiflavum TaxID=141349 RepID=A0A0E3WE10_MYCLN|nr:enoyl-CoA hydratase/isomerase family protein [Mycobacterium lentiflavum]CQD22544.1 putative enoyl-CoA hydratase/isomerase [Mycobacterium lentiflavum]